MKFVHDGNLEQVHPGSDDHHRIRPDLEPIRLLECQRLRGDHDNILALVQLGHPIVTASRILAEGRPARIIQACGLVVLARHITRRDHRLTVGDAEVEQGWLCDSGGTGKRVEGANRTEHGVPQDGVRERRGRVNRDEWIKEREEERKSPFRVGISLWDVKYWVREKGLEGPFKTLEARYAAIVHPLDRNSEHGSILGSFSLTINRPWRHG